MIRSRKPTSDDGDILRLIRQELIPLNPPRLRPTWSSRAMTKRVNQGNTFVWVPDETSSVRIAGFITCLPRQGELFVDMLALDRNAQGRGVGSMLLTKAERYGRAHGCTYMRLFVNEDNVRGIRFYQKHGMHAAWYDPAIQSYMMEKRIG
jgi:ribosomal protein S18 acetylase RimI-like enzyme